MPVNRVKQLGRTPRRCEFCGQLCNEYPKFCAWLENCTVTEKKLACQACLERILNKPGVRVIGDNVGRDQ
jgi:hypothetical protein